MGFYRVFTELYQELPGFNGVLLGFLWFDLVILERIRLYWLVLGFTWLEGVSMGFTGFYRVLPGYVVVCSTQSSPLFVCLFVLIVFFSYVISALLGRRWFYQSMLCNDFITSVAFPPENPVDPHRLHWVLPSFMFPYRVFT